MSNGNSSSKELLKLIERWADIAAECGEWTHGDDEVWVLLQKRLADEETFRKLYAAEAHAKQVLLEQLAAVEPCPTHAHPGCPLCHPDKTVPELNRQYARHARPPSAEPRALEPGTLEARFSGLVAMCEHYFGIDPRPYSSEGPETRIHEAMQRQPLPPDDHQADYAAALREIANGPPGTLPNDEVAAWAGQIASDALSMPPRPRAQVTKGAPCEHRNLSVETEATCKDCGATF